MPWFYELRYWSNGVRRCDIYLTQKAAEKAAKEQRATSHPSNGAVELMYSCSTWDPAKHYREMRKKKREDVL